MIHGGPHITKVAEVGSVSRGTATPQHDHDNWVPYHRKILGCQ
jgi:hypothetical protein